MNRPCAIRWKIASEKAVRANDLYLAYAGEPTYYLLGCCHDLHLMMFTCMFLGQYKPALWAADKDQLMMDVADDILGYGPIDRLLKDGVIAFIQKPFQLHQLSETVARAIAT